MPSELVLSTDQSVVVSPFGCAWLLSPAHKLSGQGGCLEFEAKGALQRCLVNRHVSRQWDDSDQCYNLNLGETDITVVYGPATGAKRWQHEVLRGSYTLILGSHRNSIAKLEKDNIAQAQVEDLVSLFALQK